MEEFIQLRQQRDFSTVFSDTFQFIKQNIGLLGRALLMYVGPFVLLSAILGAIYPSAMMGRAASMSSMSDIWSIFFSWQFFVLLFSSVAASAMMVATSYCFVDMYDQRNGANFTIDELWNSIKGHVVPLFGSSIVVGLIVALGLMFFLIPGIYLAVSLSFTLFIQVSEKKDLGSAMSRSFALSKTAWFQTLGLLFVMGLIIFVISWGFGLVGGLFIAIGQNYAGLGYKIYTTLTSFITSFLSVFMYLIIAFQYYNLVDTTEGTSLDKKISEWDSPQN